MCLLFICLSYNGLALETASLQDLALSKLFPLNEGLRIHKKISLQPLLWNEMIPKHKVWTETFIKWLLGDLFMDRRWVMNGLDILSKFVPILSSPAAAQWHRQIALWYWWCQVSGQAVRERNESRNQEIMLQSPHNGWHGHNAPTWHQQGYHRLRRIFLKLLKWLNSS